MWIVLIILSLASLHSTGSISPPIPTNVTFSSVNLRNTLHWLPGNGTTDDTHFTVQYAIYGDSIEGGKRVHWRPVRHCTEIVRRWCDLSNETWDLEDEYHARVRAVSGKASSKWAFARRRFHPKLDTGFGPPLVSMEIENNNAIITIMGPLRYQPNNHAPKVSMATIFPQMMYNLSIHVRGQASYLAVVSSPYKYRLMEYDTEYCFSATSKFLSMPVQCQPSERQCITTPPDPVIAQLLRVVVGIVVPSVCLCMLAVVGYLLHHYLSGKGQKSPLTLTMPPSHVPALPFTPKDPKIFMFIQSPVILEPVCPKREPTITAPSHGYMQQGPETPSEPEEFFNDESIDYGFVGVAHEADEDRQKRHDGGKHEKCFFKDIYRVNQWRVEDDPAPQMDTYLSQMSTRVWSQTHTTHKHSLTEMDTLTQAHAFSQLPGFHGTVGEELNREKEDREFQHLFIKKKCGLFHIPLSRDKIGGAARGGVGGIGGTFDEDVEEERASERVPILSAYASQNIRTMPPSSARYLPDADGIPSMATVGKMGLGRNEEEDEEREEEDEGTSFINWDPSTRKLLPDFEFCEEGGLDGLMLLDNGRMNRMGGDEEEANAVTGNLTLENVFVRQASEEEAEAQRELVRGGEGEVEVGDFLTKWDVVVSMDE
ncbi:uncharacterized protein V6R79_013072 [Siganus canaliculatus]